jgi:hypothetical protein
MRPLIDSASALFAAATAVTMPSKCVFTIRATRLIGSSRLRSAH